MKREHIGRFPPVAPVISSGAASALMILVLSACGGPDPPPELPEILAPAGLEQLDRSVRDQYAGFRQRFAARRATADAADSGRAAELGAAYGELGTWYHAYRFHVQAAEAYRQAVELDSAEPRWLYLLATVERAEGRWESAVESLEGVVAATEPEPYVPALLGWASLELEHHRLERARELYARALDREGGAVALHGLAEVALEEGRADEALGLLERALELEPEAAVLLYAAARAHRTAGDRSASAALLDRLPDDNRRRRRLRVADPWLHAVESLAVGVLDHVRAGMAARRQGRAAEALEHFQRAVAADERNLEARLQLARTWIDLRRPRDARRALEPALERFGAEPRLRFQLARAALLLGHREEAERHLEAALEVDPRHLESRLLRAELRLRGGRGEEALAQLAELRRERPDDPSVARAHAVVLEATGRREEALEALEYDLERMPGNPELEALAGRLAGAPRPEASPPRKDEKSRQDAGGP